MKRILTLLLLSIPLLALAQEEGQEPIKIKGNVVLYNTFEKKNLPPERLWYGLFRKDEAERVKDEINKISESSSGTDISAELRAQEEVTKLRKKYKIVEKTSARGAFEKSVLPGMALVFVTTLDSKAEMLEVKSGQIEYKDFIIKVERVQEVKKIGEQRERDVIGGGITLDPDDGYEYFPINLVLTKGNCRTDSRLIIQTYAVDCQTEDTLAYCLPKVYEGDVYHHMQNKRMAFNYEKNDKLAPGYDSSVVLNQNEKFILHTVVKYKKPDHLKKKAFKGPFKYVLEDFHHVYADGGWEGTCLKKRPFKFIDFSPALAQLELSREFYVEAGSNVENKSQDLNLTFEVGKDVLTTDSMNNVRLQNLIKELQQYGTSLASPSVMGAASPDGSRSFNIKIAQQRAQKAASMIQPHLSGSVRVTTSSPKVYTWGDVVEELKRKGHDSEAAQMESVLAGGGSDESLTSSMKALPFYDISVEPILRSMRKMRCTYQFIREHIMTPEECLEEYYKNKQKYIDGTKTFSNGDYYNLYSQITDSTELDILTQLSYNHIIRYDHYWEENAMAPYICNRMALMNLRRGTPNPLVLDPFIDYRRKSINASKFIDDMLTIKINRQEIVTNQAVTYYQEQKLDSAKYLINLIEGAGIKDKNIEMLKYYMDLKQLHAINRSSQDEIKYQKARDVVLRASDDNKAILYTEIDEWGMRDEAVKWVNLMEDSDPKKWYLKGLLAVETAGKDVVLSEEDAMNIDSSSERRDSIGGGFVLLTEDEFFDLQAKDMEKATAYQKQLHLFKEAHGGQLPEPKKPEKEPVTSSNEEVNMEGIPYYLAYFQHAFDLEPAYKRMYAAEGHVQEDLRRKFKYKKKNIPAYRKMFMILKQMDDKQRSKLIEAKDDMDMMDNIETEEKVQ